MNIEDHRILISPNSKATQRTKNRIREHGELWEVLELPPGVVSMSKRPALPPVKSVKTGAWRWLDEKNFEIVENNC